MPLKRAKTAGAAVSTTNVTPSGSADAAATIIQSRFRGAHARSVKRTKSAARLRPGKARSKSMKELQIEAYDRLHSESAKNKERDEQIKAHREATLNAIREKDRLHREKMVAAQQKKEQKLAALNEQELNEIIRNNATDEDLKNINLIKRKLLAQAYGADPTTFLRKIMRKHDTDGNAELDRDEFANMFKTYLQAAESRTLFAFVDEDNTGTITARELSSYLELNTLKRANSSKTRQVPTTPRSRARFVYATLANCRMNEADMAFCFKLIDDSIGAADATRARRLVQEGILLLLWQISRNYNRHFDEELQQLQLELSACIEKRAAAQDSQSSEGAAVSAEASQRAAVLRANIAQVQADEEHAAAGPKEAQTWFGWEVESSCLSQQSRDDDEKQRMLGQVTTGPPPTDAHRAECNKLLLELLRKTAQTLATSASYSKAVSSIDMPGRSAASRLLYDTVFAPGSGASSASEAANDATVAGGVNGGGATKSLQEQIAAMQAEMVRVAEMEVTGEENDNGIRWCCEDNTLCEILLRISFTHRKALLDGGGNPRKATASDILFNTQLLVVCLFLSSPAVEAVGLGKSTKSIASQVVDLFSELEASSTAIHCLMSIV